MYFLLHFSFSVTFLSLSLSLIISLSTFVSRLFCSSSISRYFTAMVKRLATKIMIDLFRYSLFPYLSLSLSLFLTWDIEESEDPARIVHGEGVEQAGSSHVGNLNKSSTEEYICR